MATVNQIKIIVEAEDKASAPIERATKSTRNLGRASREVTKESKKDWGGLADLFGGVLPRNLQSLQRGFKGTQRQVGRLSKSFKVLKTAWASIGIGLIIIAVEELVSNWDDWSEMLGLSNKELIENEKAQKRVTAQQTASKAELLRYQQTVEDTTASELDREAAMNKLAKAMPQLEGLELGSLEANEKIAQAMADQLAIIKLKDDESRNQKATEEAITAEQEQQVHLTAEQSRNVSMTADVESKLALRREFIAENRAVKEAEWAAQSAAASQSQRDTDSEINIIEQRITDQIEEQNKLRGEANEAEKELEKTKREAEAAKKKAIQDAEANAEWLANQRIDLAQETELRLIKDEEKRELRSLEMQHETAKAELALRGGTLADKLKLEQAYLLDRAEIEGEYQQQRDDKADEDGIEEAARVEALRSALATEQENEIMAMNEHYTNLLALAEVDSQEYIDLEQRQKDALDKINGDYNDRTRAADQKTDNQRLAAKEKLVGSISGLLRELGDAAEEGSDKQKRLAIADVLINQAVAMARAVSAAAGSVTTPPTPFAPLIFAANVASMLGTVAATFTSIKGIMGSSGGGGGVGGGGGGGGGRSGFAPVSAQVPLPARLDSTDMQAFVVQSQLQGQINAQHRLNGQIVL